MNALFQETKNLRIQVADAIGSRVGDLYFESQVIQFTEKIAIAFCAWRRSREFEINCLEQKTHNDAELFHYFRQEYKP